MMDNIEDITRRFLREKTRIQSLLLDSPLRNLELFWLVRYKALPVRKTQGMYNDDDDGDQFARYVFTVNTDE